METKNEWKETTLGAQGVRLQHGFTFPSDELSLKGDLPVIRIGNVHRGDVVVDERVRYSGTLTDKLTPYTVSRGDILVVMTGGDESQLSTATGRVGRYKEGQPALLNQRVAKVLTPENVDRDFVFYFLSQENTTRHLASTANGSVQKNLTNSHILDLGIRIPRLPEQCSVVAILRCLDNKIELLRKQNETLDQIARAFFKKRLQDFTLTNTTGTISEVADHIRDSVSPAKRTLEVFAHYSIPAYDNNKTPVFENGSLIMSNKYRVLDGSILFSKLNPETPRVWAVLNAEDNAICSTEFQVIKPKEGKYFAFLYALLRYSELARELANKVQGTSSSHQRLKPADILGLKFPMLTQEALAAYHSIAYPLLKLIDKNEKQMRILATTRDMLLPKLMHGELRVS